MALFGLTHRARNEGVRFVVPQSNGSFLGMHTHSAAQFDAEINGTFGFWRFKDIAAPVKWGAA